VPIVFNVLIGLVAVIPVMAILDGPTARDVLTVPIVAALAIAANSSSAGEVAHAAAVTRRLRFIAAVPVSWFIVQLMPIPDAFSNSIWAAAGTALGQPLHGHISIDIGNTANATIAYLTSMALIVVVIFAAKDRGRAELLLYCLCIVTTFTVVALWFFELASNPTIGESATYSREMLSGTAAQGVILNLAAGLRTVERHKSWTVEKRLFRSALWLLSLCAACLAICLLAIVFMMPANIGIVTSFGVVTLCLIEVIRRGKLAAWSSLTLGATLLSMLGMIVAWRYNLAQPLSLTLRFSDAPAETVATVERMLSDLRWAGNGAGTFPALWQIYHYLGAATAAQVPTTAASIVIGGGAVLLLTEIAGAALLFVILFRGALARGRDSLYPAAAAASVAILFGEAFCDASLQTTAVTLIATVSIGLGLTQSVSQANGDNSGSQKS
jgi:hypothetical protein